MIVVASSLLPGPGLLLHGMDRVEDWLRNSPSTARHARGRHLHLVHGTGRPQGPADRAPQHFDAV